jgi:hypothetical protein
VRGLEWLDFEFLIIEIASVRFFCLLEKTAILTSVKGIKTKIEVG